MLSSMELYKKRYNNSIMFVLIYVDDIIITGNSPNMLKLFIENLNSIFALKDLGHLNYFLGIEAYRDRTGLYLKQEKYVENLLRKFSMDQCATAPTPMVVNCYYSKEDGTTMKNPTVYRQAIGSLQYLVTTRPDIIFVVNKLSQFLNAPTDVHWKALKRVFCYLRGISRLALHIKPCDFLQLQGFLDADWAICLDDRRSIGGHCAFLGDSLIS
ncbi:uncharacterized mitochondrial protein AtMg00810-like [Prosopis cineraria]|uniref:uncharacterized mitochondrial protein AtMg00810-like n=1 Tax=Prosopis cineraria TaxID=364024 RepID=UPI00240EEC04|nr:uncharacterized mitochondrial protein AtMg00810-like [Prosopis cineraria]